MSNFKITQSTVRLDYLDGLRGLAALYIVLFHVYFDLGALLSQVELSHLLSRLTWLGMSHGKICVAIFIVLSGYCLMLPVARSANGQLKGGVLNYLKRRALRIMPAYYIVLILSLILWILLPAEVISATGVHWNKGQPALMPISLFSHFLLLHDLLPEYSLTINPPMWSVAVEWHIYFIFPLLLLPIWRRFGIIPTIAIAYVASLVLKDVMCSSHFIILFSLGMVAAIIGFSKQPSLLKWKEKIPWDIFVLVLGMIYLILFLRHGDEYMEEMIVGTATACLIISCTQFLVEGKKTMLRSLLNFLESEWLVAVGAFSYSLYLVHAPVLAVFEVCLNNMHLPPMIKFLALITLVLPLSVLISYVFHLICEKPFLSLKKKAQ